MWTASAIFSKTAPGESVPTLSELCRKAEFAALETEKDLKHKGQPTSGRTAPRRKPVSCEL